MYPELPALALDGCNPLRQREIATASLPRQPGRQPHVCVVLAALVLGHSALCAPTWLDDRAPLLQWR